MKTGHFIYQDAAFKGISVYRDQFKQSEVMGDSITAIFDIHWSDDLNYTLVPEKVIYKSKESPLPKDTLRVSIIRMIGDLRYICRVINSKDTSEMVMIRIGD